MFQDYLQQYRESITECNPKNGICFDGAVEPDIYMTKRPRLLFFLKETNGNNNDGSSNTELSDWNYMEWVRNQACQKEPLYRSVYRNIAMWSKQFEMYASGHEPVITDLIDCNGLIINEDLCRALSGIALINLKKSWGKEQTDWSAMKRYLDEDPLRREILIHQIDALEPDLVLCGGTFDFVHNIFCSENPFHQVLCEDGQRIDYFQRGRTVFVSCYHPSKPGWAREDSFKHAYNIFHLYFNGLFA